MTRQIHTHTHTHTHTHKTEIETGGGGGGGAGRKEKEEAKCFVRQSEWQAPNNDYEHAPLSQFGVRVIGWASLSFVTRTYAPPVKTNT